MLFNTTQVQGVFQKVTDGNSGSSTATDTPVLRKKDPSSRRDDENILEYLIRRREENGLMMDNLRVTVVESELLGLMKKHKLIILVGGNNDTPADKIFGIDKEKLEAMAPEAIKEMQRLLQKDNNSYPKGKEWIDGDVINGTRTLEALEEVLDVNISQYMQNISLGKEGINIGIIQPVEASTSPQRN